MVCGQSNLQVIYKTRRVLENSSEKLGKYQDNRQNYGMKSLLTINRNLPKKIRYHTKSMEVNVVF